MVGGGGGTVSVFVNGLRQFFPGIQILSEETDPEVKHVDVSIVPGVQVANDHWLNLNEVLITVDPLDATKEFTENLTQYVTTMVSRSSSSSCCCCRGCSHRKS